MKDDQKKTPGGEPGAGLAESESQYPCGQIIWRKFPRPVQYFTTNMVEDDWECDKLSLREQGAYHNLRKAYLQNGGPLPVDWRWLWLRARATTKEEKTAVKRLMPKCFVRVLADDGQAFWVNEGCDRELAHIVKRMSASVAKSVDVSIQDKPNKSAEIDFPVKQLSSKPVNNNEEKQLKENCSGERTGSLSPAALPAPKDKTGSPVASPPPPTTTQVGGDKLSLLNKHTPLVPQLGQAHLSPPWGEGKQWQNYEEWQADPTTGMAPTEEEKEEEMRMELIRKLRKGDLFVSPGLNPDVAKPTIETRV